jgi:hypothetical protein
MAHVAKKGEYLMRHGIRLEPPFSDDIRYTREKVEKNLKNHRIANMFPKNGHRVVGYSYAQPHDETAKELSSKDRSCKGAS